MYVLIKNKFASYNLKTCYVVQDTTEGRIFMYNLKTENRSIKELLEGLKNQTLIREGLQRTPSHDEKKASEILTSIYQKKYSGCLHFSMMENDTLSILDGSSRLQDIENFVNNSGNVFIKKLVMDTEKEKEVLQKVKFSELTETEKNDFLNYAFPCIILEGVNNSETFVSLNNSTALSNIQKVKGNLPEDFTNIIETLKNSKIMTNTLSNRQIQKDEVVIIAFQILSNIYGCYTATNKKLVENVKNTNLLNFDIERFKGIIEKFDNIDVDVNKYTLISLISVLYNSPLSVDDMPVFDNNVIFKVETAGANSTPENEKRLAKAVKKLNDIIGVSVKNGRKITKTASGVEVEETTIDLNEFLAN